MADTPLLLSDERNVAHKLRGHLTPMHVAACPICTPRSAESALTEALSYEGQKDAWIDDLLTYLHFDPATNSHPDWVARAQDAETRLAKINAICHDRIMHVNKVQQIEELSK